jgi:pimeloyl-ACP methyl ester carboxylesterase
MSAGHKLPGTPEPMHYWDAAGGVCIAGDSWGNAADPLVLLLHGGGQTRHAWKNVAKRLGSAGFHAVAFDARGHGDSDWAPDGRYGPDVMIEDLQHVIAACGGQVPALVGASMGGGTSLIAVGEGKLPASALVLVDIAPRIEMHGVKRIKAFMEQNADGFGSMEEVADSIAAYQPHRKRPDTLKGLAKNVRLRDGRLYWHWDPRIRESDDELEQRITRFEACARGLMLPTLLVRGGMSDVVSDEGAQAFKELCPHSEYVNVSDAGHMVAGDRNDIFGNAVIKFLSRALHARQQRVSP